MRQTTAVRSARPHRHAGRRRASLSPLRIRTADVPACLRSLLVERGSLTRRLMALSKGRFRVRVDSEQWCAPDPEERKQLGMRGRQHAWVREVTLLCEDTPVVHARSVIPRAALRGRFRRLRRLGARPLGELLFTEKGVVRGRMQLIRVTLRDRPYVRASRRATPASQEFWGRRSLYYIASTPLLVAEIFLTDMTGFSA